MVKEQEGIGGKRVKKSEKRRIYDIDWACYSNFSLSIGLEGKLRGKLVDADDAPFFSHLLLQRALKPRTHKHMSSDQRTRSRRTK